MKPGEQYRVKATPLLRKYGIRTHGSWQAKGDDHVFPGEIGTVVKHEWKTSRDEPMSCLKLEFSRGRAISIPEPREDQENKAYWAEKLKEFKADFVKVKVQPTPEN